MASALAAAGLTDARARARALLFERLDGVLAERGVTARHHVHVPGRIEVLGKHTDYAGGRSLVCAVDRGFAVALAPRSDRSVRLIDVGRSDEVTLELAAEPLAAGAPHWAIYPGAVARRLVRDFPGSRTGVDIAFTSDLPPSSGLSSSSTLLIATFEALRIVNDLDAREDFARALPGVLDVAAYLGSVESGRPFRNFGGEAGVGTSGGSQDHTAILASRAGHVCRVGYAPPRIEGFAPVPKGFTFVVAVSGVVAQKTGGARAAYNRAAAHGAALLDLWRGATGRSDSTLFEAIASHGAAVDRLRHAIRARSAAAEPAASDLEARLKQFVDETFVLIPEAFAALERGDLEAFGRAVARSQRGAERGLANQVPETIELVRIAREHGAVAASAFGAGFGGSVWALVASAGADGFMARWRDAYLARFDHPTARFLEVEAGPPLLRLPGRDEPPGSGRGANVNSLSR